MASQVQKRDVIIAIDFGTTYSGFGYAFLNAFDDHIYDYQKWGRGQGMACSKTPTALLLTEEGELHKFGHAAVTTYAKQAAAKDCKKLLYFDKFKLLLHSKEVYFFHKQTVPQESEEAVTFARKLANIGMSLPQYIEAFEKDDDERTKHTEDYATKRDASESSSSSSPRKRQRTDNIHTSSPRD